MKHLTKKKKERKRIIPSLQGLAAGSATERCGEKPWVSTGALAPLQVGGFLPVSYYSNAVFKSGPKKWSAK